MFRFNRTYFILAVILFLIEVYIAIYVNDAIVRPYVGDLLVVILLYCIVRSLINTPPLKTALAVLVFAYIIEFLQYLKLVKILGLEKSRLANVIIGNSFEWIDMIAYTLGAFIIVVSEYYAARMRTRKVIRNIEL